ncbi:unnamed protein product [Amaranthus hypochondriacus]
MVEFDVLGRHISFTTVELAAIAVGIGVVLIILILLCCWCCSRRKQGKQKRYSHSIPLQNPPAAAPTGNHEGGAVQQRQRQKNPPIKPEHDMYPVPAPRAAALPLHHQRQNQVQQQHQQQQQRHLQREPSVSSSTGSNSLPAKQALKRAPTPEDPSSYNLSSLPPPSPTYSYGSSQIMFTYDELAMATNGFSKANLLGQGGFGFVHKGILPNGKQIAVKSLRANSGQGVREFEAEVEIISRVHHRHLVSLVGYCIHGAQRLLVYEFVPNKTLEFHLHGTEKSFLDWPTRQKVAVGAAKGLAYLHEDCQPRIIHRDIKAANILLDNSFQAKVADFGLAKLTLEADTHVSTRVMGTLGYLAPEYASSGRLTDKSDVYSFGVMLLELITGRRPVDRTQKEYNLVEWAKPFLTSAMEDENFTQLVDPRLQFSYKNSEMARMVACAATCVRKSARHRPLMSQVVRTLEGNMTLSELTNEITPGRSMIQRYDTVSENSNSQYKNNSKGFQSTNTETSTREYVSSEYDGTTSEYGLYASSSCTESQTTHELNTEEMQRQERRFQPHF